MNDDTQVLTYEGSDIRRLYHFQRDARGVVRAYRIETSVRMSSGQWTTAKLINKHADFEVPEYVRERARTNFEWQDAIAYQTRHNHKGWKTLDTVPRDGTKFDAWCVHPDCSQVGVRIPDVQMRADGSGFGYLLHGDEDVKWQYLDARDGDPMPKWIPTHWMEVPDGPHV